jgi:hypothetical protein
MEISFDCRGRSVEMEISFDCQLKWKYHLIDLSVVDLATI